MSEIVVIAPGGGEIVGDSPERRVEILSDHPSLHATWSRFGPGRDGADPHVHRRHTDVFYVLAGELTVRLGLEDRQVTVPTGTVARVPPMVVHGFRNASDAELRYLNFHAPGEGFAGYMRALRDGRRLVYDQEDPPAEGVRPASDAVIGGPPVELDAIAVREIPAEPGERRYGGLVSYYVLDGELDGAPAGAWIQVPPGGPHELAGHARLLEIRTPDV